MDIVKKLELILNKLIVSKNDDIVGVEVKQYGGIHPHYFFEIEYELMKGKRPDKVVLRDLVIETVSIFEMLGLEKGSDVNVLFKVDEKYN